MNPGATLNIQTHQKIDTALCGVPVSVGDGQATVQLTTLPSMVVDGEGLVHGGFVFGAADHAAMLAVNDPLVVLGASECRFTAPVQVGQVVEIEAKRVEHKGRKHVISVSARVGALMVFSGTFTTFVLDQHVLASKPLGS